jgi:hypothetical protein
MVLNLCKSGRWSFVAKSLICLKIWNHFFTSIQFLNVRNHVNPVDFVIAIAECVHKTISISLSYTHETTSHGFISFSAQSFILHPVDHLPPCGFSSSHLVSWNTKPILCRLPIECASSNVDSSDIQSLIWLNCSASQQCNQLLYEVDFFVACRYRLSFNNKSGLKD